MCKASLILSWKDAEAVSRIEKQSSERKAPFKEALHIEREMKTLAEQTEIIIIYTLYLYHTDKRFYLHSKLEMDVCSYFEAHGSNYCCLT